MTFHDSRNNNATGQGGEGRKAKDGNPNLNGNSVEAQRQRILNRLRLGPATTIQLRRDEDCMMPAARIFELRDIGHQIELMWVYEPTEGGKLHRVGKYILIREAL